MLPFVFFLFAPSQAIKTMALKLEPPKKRSRASPFEIGSGFLLWFSVCVALFFFCLPSVVALFRSFSVISLFFPCVFLCAPCFWAPLASVFFSSLFSPLVLPFSSALFSVCVCIVFLRVSLFFFVMSFFIFFCRFRVMAFF